MFTGWFDASKRPTREHRGIVLTAQIDWELRELIGIYDELKPRHVLEIGTQKGGTLWYWLEGRDPGTIVVNIDILQNTTDSEKTELPMRWASWSPHGVVYHGIIGRSDDPAVIEQARQYLDGAIDFLFIDAVHTYEGARHDWLTYGPMVRSGGIVAFHDLVVPDFSPHIRVIDLWREIQAAGYNTRELRAGAKYGGIGIVYID
jgi:cephalosporin hydroxylase